MAKYNSVIYGQSVYGQKSRLAFSVDPFVATAIDYTTISLEWSAPVGGYTAFRLVRNQNGYSETAEDGAVIYEEVEIDGSVGSVSISSFTDGLGSLAPALVGGKFAYYRIWLLKSTDNVWYPAGDTGILMPYAHPTYGPNKQILETTHDKVMDLLPRVYTSISHGPLDAVNPDSDLYRFLQGFSFTLDEFLSLTDSLMPDFSGKRTNPNVISVQAEQLGLTLEPSISVKNQKRMIREALYLYGKKGTLAGLTTLVESLTGYDSEVTESSNLMLSNSDSSFYKGLGFWLPIGECALTLDDTTLVTSESGSIDSAYSAKVVVASAGAYVSNGLDNPVTHGVPVEEEREYAFSFYSIVASGTTGVIPSITWHDFTGAVISETIGASVSSTTTWDKNTLVATSPAEATYASLKLEFEGANTFNLDMIQFAESYVEDFTEARSVTVFLNPSKVNYLANPSFEEVNSKWSVSGVTAAYVTEPTPPQVLVGTKVLQVPSGTSVISSSTLVGEVPTGAYVNFSIYAKAMSAPEESTISVTALTEVSVNEAQVVNMVAYLTMTFNNPIGVGDYVTVAGLGAPYDGVHVVSAASATQIAYAVGGSDIPAAGVTGTATLSVSTNKVVDISTEWSRVQVSTFIPATFTQGSTTFSVGVQSTLTDGILLDAAQLESSYLATDYFDGSYGTERDSGWFGTPNQSGSYYYPNKIINVSRLAAEVPKFIPIDTPWRILSESGTEASGIS